MPCNRIRLPPGLRPTDDVDEMLLEAGIIPTSMNAILTDENGNYREEFNCDGCSDSGHSDNGRALGGRPLGRGRGARDYYGDNYGVLDFDMGGGRRGSRATYDSGDEAPLDSDDDLGGIGGLGGTGGLGEREMRMNRLRGDLRTWARGEYDRRGAEMAAGPAGGGQGTVGGRQGGTGLGGGGGDAGRRGRRNDGRRLRPRSRAGRNRRGRRHTPADYATDRDDSESDSTGERAHRALGRTQRNRGRANTQGAGRTLGGRAGGRRRGGYDSDSDDSSAWSEDFRSEIWIWW